MKKYPFPPDVTLMSDAAYKEHCRTMAAAQKAERDARKAHTEAMRKRRAEVRATMPTARITALNVGASLTLEGYTKTTQVSSAIRHAYVATGGRYASKLARSLLDGETVIGVTVSREK